MKRLILVLMVVFLSACDLLTGAGGSNTELPPPPPIVYEWSNLVKVANTYDYAPPLATLDDFLAIGQIAATPDAVCIVVWETTTRAYAGCRNTASDGQWPSGCIVNTDETVTCTTYGSIAFFFMESLGSARTLTIAEAELADEIRRKTKCDAPRLDLSVDPCTVL